MHLLSLFNRTPSHTSHLNLSTRYQSEDLSIPPVLDLSDEALNHRMQVAKKAAEAAGKVLIQAFKTPDLVVYQKNNGHDTSLVTQVDYQAQATILRHLKTAFPHDRFISEEHERSHLNNPNKAGVWIIDPLDGTSNFARGVGYFGVSIAYVVNGKPFVAVVHSPSKAETFATRKGLRHVLWYTPGNLKPFKTTVEGYQDLRQKRRYITVHPSLTGRLLADLKNTTIRRFCATALDLAHVSTGRLDASVDKGFETWDIAAGWLLVDEAGGRITRLDGQPISLTAGKKLDLVAAVNPDLHQQLVSLSHSTKHASK